MHGESGKGGILGLADVPSDYSRQLASSLPFKAENPEAFAIVEAYCKNIIENVDKGVGFYFYSIPNRDNPKGTGTGKTTASAAIINEYVVSRVVQQMKQLRTIDKRPALFVRASKFQNVFNSQFRGTPDMQQDASRKYYGLKENMISVDLLVIDDIGVREATPAFLSEMFEIIDERSSERRATIFSSNVPLSDLHKLLDERIASRIDGMTAQISFSGKDNRKGGMFA
ncbi:ATP-binding protein [Paenibacillus jamilae]|uniref:ATP-binding protein n=1 Tax=Paenibacillus jamilae TaxID=114136 RepID=UPI001FCD28FD|nr:ATP-binding protein [Paenibacillus jamilae]